MLICSQETFQSGDFYLFSILFFTRFSALYCRLCDSTLPGYFFLFLGSGSRNTISCRMNGIFSGVLGSSNIRGVQSNFESDKKVCPTKNRDTNCHISQKCLHFCMKIPIKWYIMQLFLIFQSFLIKFGLF